MSSIVATTRKQFARQSHFQVALVVVAVVVLNLAVSGLTWRWDITKDKLYSLSPASTTIVQQLVDPVTFKLYFSKDVPQDLLAVRRDVEDVLAEYRQTGRDITVVMADPKTDLSAQTEVDTYGIPEIQYNVVNNDKFEVSTGYAGLVILYRDQNTVLPALPNVANLEYDITAALQKMSRTDAPTIGWLSDHGTIVGRTVQQYLEQQYTITPVTLAALSPDLTNVVIAGPTEEFTEAEQYTLDQFVMRGGNLYMLLDGMTINQQLLQASPMVTGLDDWLTHYGITVNHDVVADFASNETLTFGGQFFSVVRPYPYWPKIVSAGLNPNSPMVAQLTAISLPWTSSLTITPADDRVVTELANTSPQSTSSTAVTSIDPEAIVRSTDSDLQQYLVAALVTGSFTSAYTADTVPTGSDASQFIGSTDQANLVIVSNSRFIADDIIGDNVDNALLLANAIDALSQQTSLVDIRSRASLQRPLNNISDQQKTATKYGNLVGSVLLVLVGASVVYGWRRRHDIKAKQLYA
ncbi:MAG: GldG family protein [Candidatus Kerfeldbacteria bacterium]|nr:GldG family protein [Candidatus Kerfeldbacteria bacterium]